MNDTKTLFSTAGLVVRFLVASMPGLAAAPIALADTVLYGGLGGHGVASGPQASTNDGSLVIVSQTDGGTTLVGHPDGVARISGLAFGPDGTLFGATQLPGGFPPPPGPNSPSELIRIDPDTGALLSRIPITDGAVGISIADLAVHPASGVLYGMRGPNDQLGGEGRLYVIDTKSGAATLVGETHKFFGSIAFGVDGKLYMSSADVDATGAVNPQLLTLNPSNAAILAAVMTPEYYSALAVRPSDGVIFGGTGDKQGVHRIDPGTGAATLIGLTGRNLVGDFAFRTQPVSAFDLNQQGLTGSWYQPVTSGQGVEIEVYQDLVAAGTGFLQGSWFTFDYRAAGGAASQRWYTFGGTVATGQPSAALTLYQNTGGNFNAPPVTSAVAVGTVVLSFADCAQATMAYTLTDGSGRTGTIPMVRLTPNVTCSTGGPIASNADFAYSGNWFDPATSGQGIVLELNPNAPAVFFAWYTYAPIGQSQGEAGQRWYTGLASYSPGARTLPMTLRETTGGLFDSATPAPSTVPVGTATVAFTNCNAAQLTFNFTGGGSAGSSGTINLVRVGPVPAGCGP